MKLCKSSLAALMQVLSGPLANLFETVFELYNLRICAQDDFVVVTK